MKFSDLSAREQQFLAAWRKYGIPDSEPEWQWQHEDLRSPSGRIYKWDFAWPSICVLIEIQGVGRHNSIRGLADDAHKQRVALAAGYVVIPITSACMGSQAAREDVCAQVETITQVMGQWRD